MSRHQHHHHNPHHASPPPKRKFHQHWLFVTAVILMLIAMGIYLLTMDESTLPVMGPGSQGVVEPVAP